MLTSQQKFIHENKYKNIKPIIDTGCSKSNYDIYLKEKFRDMLIKENEGFKRIKVTSLLSLMKDIAAFKEQLQNKNNEDGDGEDLGTLHPQKFENPLLLLDVREYEDYKKCHIKGAINYPHTHLFRGANQYSNDILKYRNRNDRLIIVYDKNERLAQKVAQGLLERNILNCFMLSGGIIAMLREGPEQVEGNIPEEFNAYIKRRVFSAPLTSSSSLPSRKCIIANKLNSSTNSRNFSGNIYNAYNNIMSNRLNSHSSTTNYNNNNININNHKSNNNSFKGQEECSSWSRPSTASSTTSNASTFASISSTSNLSSSSSSSSSSCSSFPSTTTTTTIKSKKSIHFADDTLPSSSSSTPLFLSSPSSPPPLPPPSEKKFERITYYSDLKKPQPITDPFDFSNIKKNLPGVRNLRKKQAWSSSSTTHPYSSYAFTSLSQQQSKQPSKQPSQSPSQPQQPRSRLAHKPPSPPPFMNTNYHALWRIKPKPITEKITRIKMNSINNKR